MELSNDLKKEMAWLMLLARRTDERAWVLHRQGKIAFHISGIGHEAAQVGAALAVHKGEDWVTPYYRDLALMLAMGMTPRDFMLSLMGKAEEPASGGRQMPSHWSLRKLNIVSHSAPVATQTTHAAGIGLAMKLRGDHRFVLSTIGEGSTSQGEWYEGVNWAAVHQLPVVFLVQNNQYAISVPVKSQMAVPSSADKACGLGLPGRTIDGTDVFAIYQAVSEAAELARTGGGPTLLEARMYRITPHSSDDDDRTYRTREEVEEHKKLDPLKLMRKRLEDEGVLTAQDFEEMEARIKEMIDEAVRYAEQAAYPEVEFAAGPVYA